MNKPLLFRAVPFCFVLFLVLLSGCNDSPYQRTSDTSGSGGTGSFGVAPAYVIFNDELMSGGGAFLYPGDAGQSLSFNDRSNPIGQRAIRYSWTGESVASQIVFTGVTLMHTPTQATYTSAAGRDLRQAGYTKVKFYARGSLSSFNLVKIEVADDGVPYDGVTGTPNLSCVSLSTGTMDANAVPCGRTDTLTADWREYTIPISVPSTALAAVKDFFKATFVFNNPNPGSPAPGQGGTVYIDQIRYEP